MREDMHKIAVERPRIGHDKGEATARCFRREAKQELHMADYEEDVLPIRESMKFRSRAGDSLKNGRKSFNENLNPIHRWLRSQVGRKWDEVYSELCQRLNRNNVCQNHLLFHIEEDVETKTFVENGYIGVNSYFGPASIGPNTFYVHPLDGTLRLSAAKSYKRDWKAERKAAFDENRYIDPKNPLIQYHRIKGVWYEIRLEKILPKPKGIYNINLYTGEPFHDRVTNSIIKSNNYSNWTTNKDIYEGDYYPTYKRQINKREVDKIEQARNNKQRKAA